jgi:hypothetical protein
MRARKNAAATGQISDSSPSNYFSRHPFVAQSRTTDQRIRANRITTIPPDNNFPAQIAETCMAASYTEIWL